MQLTLLRVFMAIVLSGFVLGSSDSYADDTAALKQQIGQLNDRITQLEKQLAQKQQSEDQDASQAWSTGYAGQWDPFAEMEMMQRNVRGMMGSTRDDALLNPSVDIKESPKEYIITMDIPGMNKENIEVKVEGRSLIVSGERSTDKADDQKGKMIHRERSYSHFMRVVPLPADAKSDAIDADYKNGVLNVHVGRKDNGNKPAAQKITVK